MRIIFSLLLVGISLPIFSQSQVVMQQTIKDQATTMLEAFEDHNYDKLLDYTYPKIFELSGGKATKTTKSITTVLTTKPVLMYLKQLKKMPLLLPDFN